MKNQKKIVEKYKSFGFTPDEIQKLLEIQEVEEKKKEENYEKSNS